MYDSILCVQGYILYSVSYNKDHENNKVQEHHFFFCFRKRLSIPRVHINHLLFILHNYHSQSRFWSTSIYFHRFRLCIFEPYTISSNDYFRWWFSKTKDYTTTIHLDHTVRITAAFTESKNKIHTAEIECSVLKMHGTHMIIGLQVFYSLFLIYL